MWLGIQNSGKGTAAVEVAAVKVREKGVGKLIYLTNLRTFLEVGKPTFI